MIHYIFLRTSAQATEDLEKVKSALKLFIPPLDKTAENDSDLIRETVTTGHYGNPITLMEVQIKKKKDCLFVIDVIKQHLDVEDLSRLIAQLPQRVDDDCNVYIRFNKQEAYQGRLKITSASDSILIRIKLQAYPAKREKALQVAEELLKQED
jgi:RNA binding exosome subunit